MNRNHLCLQLVLGLYPVTHPITITAFEYATSNTTFTLLTTLTYRHCYNFRLLSCSCVWAAAYKLRMAQQRLPEHRLPPPAQGGPSLGALPQSEI